MNSEQPVLIYDRIDANRQKTVTLLALFSVILLPPLLFWGSYLWFWILMVSVMIFPGLIEMSALPKVSLFEYLLIKTFSPEVLERTDPGWTALPEFILISVVFVIVYLEYRYGSSLILRLTRAKPVNSETEKDLVRTVENLCIGAGLPKPELYIMESEAPNAFAAGRDPEHACVIVTRGLLRLLDRRELEGVIAHELSHIGNYDIRLSTVVTALVWTLKLPVSLLLKLLGLGFRLNRVVGTLALLWLTTVGLAMVSAIPAIVSFYAELLNDPKTRSLAIILFMGSAAGLYVFFIAPFAGLFTRLALSRGREFLADADAALLTRYPEGLARALAKISAVGDTGIRVNPLTTHLYVVDPSPKRFWWRRIFASHPPVEERITVLASMGSGILASTLEAAETAGIEYSRSEARTGDQTVKQFPQLREILGLGFKLPLDKQLGILFLAVALFGKRLLFWLPEGAFVALTFIALSIGFVLLAARRQDGRLVVGYGQEVMDAKTLIILLAGGVIFISVLMLLVNILERSLKLCC